MNDNSHNGRKGFWGTWQSIPLYARILLGMVLGIIAGLALGEQAWFLDIPAKVVLRLLGAIAPMLILVAVIHVLITTDIQGRMATRLARLLILNTLVAILIGLAVANVLQPGKRSSLPLSPTASETEVAEVPRIEPRGPAEEPTLAEQHEARVRSFLENVPDSMLGPFVHNQVIAVIIIALGVGLALRRIQHTSRTVLELVDVIYKLLIILLHWVIELVPIGVFAIVAKVVGTEGFGLFVALVAFIASVIVALLLQTTWYLVRIRLYSWARPMAVLRGVRDALVMAFSTASSTATMPVTYTGLTKNVGLREQSASMGALVGANFNNDGTALYEAMAALFVAQLIGQDLSIYHQVLIVLTSVVASVGAAGIPEAGLVTMTLVFKAVGLPIEYIAVLITVDWFLDRCRTTINVLGDVNVSCMLDGREPPAHRPVTPITEALEAAGTPAGDSASS